MSRTTALRRIVRFVASNDELKVASQNGSQQDLGFLDEVKAEYLARLPQGMLEIAATRWVKRAAQMNHLFLTDTEAVAIARAALGDARDRITRELLAMMDVRYRRPGRHT